MRSPISNTFARYENAERRHNEALVKNNKVLFSPWRTIHESNPQEILERGEKISLVPFLIMQGGVDDNMLPAVQERFVETCRAAGRRLRLSPVRELGSRMGRRARSADGQGARCRQGIHRTAAEGLNPAPAGAKRPHMPVRRRWPQRAVSWFKASRAHCD
jgi:hypothetical protein